MPAEVLHVGDHVEMDVAGAAHAGLRACWLNRVGGRWEREDLQPGLEFVTLTELADWAEAQAREEDIRPEPPKHGRRANRPCDPSVPGL